MSIVHYIDEEVKYAVIIRDYVPEVWLGIAYRRAKQFGAERQKIIKCPYCTNHLTVIDAAAKVEVYQYPKKKKTDVVCHEYRRCNSCRETVGILFAVG